MTDGSRAPTPVVTAGLDLGDKYSYLYLIDHHSGEVMAVEPPPPPLGSFHELEDHRKSGLT